MRFHLSKRMRLKLHVAVAVALGLLGLFMLRDGDSPNLLWVVACVAPALLLAFVQLVLFVVLIWAYRQEPKLHDEYILQLAPTGIELRTAGIASHIEWTFYRELRSDKHTHLLLYGKNGFTALPRRVFAGAEQEAAFLQLVREHIGLPGGSRPAPAAS